MLDADPSFIKGDPAAVRQALPEEAIRWIDPLHSDELLLAGSNVALEEQAYVRLNKAERDIMATYKSDDVFLCTWPAGLQMRFETDAKTLLLDVELAAPANMCHMPATGQCGFDLYVYDEKKKHFVFHNAGTYDMTLKHYRTQLFLYPWDQKGVRKCIVNFPLYQGVTSVKVGIEKEAFMHPIGYGKKKKVVLYGTSIAEGGVVSRPGMLYTNLLSRWMDREFLNYGFSGAALLEPKLGTILGQRPDQALFVVDAEANAGCESWMRDNLYAFLDNYFALQPKTPVVLMNRIRFAFDLYDKRRIALSKFYLAFLKEAVAHYRAEGRDIYFLDARPFFKGDFTEYTVDSIHPNDLGAMAMAKGQYPLFRKLTENQE